MKIAKFLKRIFKKKKKNSEEQDISCRFNAEWYCRTCRFNVEWHCSHPYGGCHDYIDAVNRWEPKKRKMVATKNCSNDLMT